MTEQIKCPKCGSESIRKQVGFPKLKPMGAEPKTLNIVPNVCLEENCGYEWFDKA